MKRGDRTVQFIARTAIGIALVILAQLIGKLLPAGAVIAGPFSVTQLVTGSLVNCVLFVFTAQVAVSPLFLSWLLGFGTKARILYPQWVIDQCTDLCKTVLQQYQASENE